MHKFFVREAESDAADDNMDYLNDFTSSLQSDGSKSCPKSDGSKESGNPTSKDDYMIYL